MNAIAAEMERRTYRFIEPNEQALQTVMQARRGVGMGNTPDRQELGLYKVCWQLLPDLPDPLAIREKPEVVYVVAEDAFNARYYVCCTLNVRAYFMHAEKVWAYFLVEVDAQ